MRAAFSPRLALISALSALLRAGGRLGPSIHAQAGARERTLFVSALDRAASRSKALGPDDFVVSEDGGRREVLRVSRAPSRSTSRCSWTTAPRPSARSRRCATG